VTPQVYPTETAVGEALARRVADAIRAEPTMVLGLPTGRTPLALYARLAELSRQEQIDWSGVRTFNLDEFVGLSADHPGSYRAFMHRHLFRHVNIRPENIGFLDGMAPDLPAECRRYEWAISAAGGIDLMMLGIGINGHIGFNEPAEELATRSHQVTLDDRSRAANAMWFDGDISRVPREALSMGMATIMCARDIVLMATGEPKAEVVKAMMEGCVTTRLPASFLQLHRRVTVMRDEPAAALLAD
jgi:glucosamine-6-phosphate deaminase